MSSEDEVIEMERCPIHDVEYPVGEECPICKKEDEESQCTDGSCRF